MAEPILIWGAGAIGGTIGAHWARAGHEVALVDVVPEHVEACRNQGLAIAGPVVSFTIRIPAFLPAELSGEFSRIILAVKAQHTVEATMAAARYLRDDGFILSAQNGLNELVIADIVGIDRTMGAFVNFGADWHGPGRILYGNRGAVVVGEAAGPILERTQDMHRLLLDFEPDAVLSDDIWSYLWGKLGYGAMLFATALTNESMADNFADSSRARVFIQLGREVMAVAAARGVTPRGFNGFDPAAFAADAGLQQAEASIAALAEFNRQTAKTHSGVWRDLAVRKRRTEVDLMLGAITKLGDQLGVPTPGLKQLVALIHDIEDGRKPLSSHTFAELFETCALT